MNSNSLIQQQNSARIAKAEIFGKTEEENQVVWFEFEYFTGWNTPEKLVYADMHYHVNFCKLLAPIVINASDLTEDITVAVAIALGEPPENIRIECEIETMPVPEHLFV